MIDARELLDQFLGSQVPGMRGSVRTRRARPSISPGTIRWRPARSPACCWARTGRQIAGNALTLGGLAAIAGLGYQAYKNYQAGNTPQPAPQPAQQAEPQFLPPPSNSGFSTAPAIASNDFALTLVRAMIAAARADGHIDDAERQHILGKVHEAGVGAEAEAFFEARACQSCRSRRHRRIGADGKAARAGLHGVAPGDRAGFAGRSAATLDLLAGRLGLPDALVDHIEATVASAKV